MALSTNPMRSGQFDQAIQKITEAERQPIKIIEDHKAREESKLKLFNEFKSKFTSFDKALDDLSDYKKFREFKVDLGSGQNKVDVAIDKEKVQGGSYDIEISQLAKRSAIISSGFADPNTAVLGAGTVVYYDKEGEKQTLEISYDNSSVKDVVAKINNQTNGSLKASVIQDGTDESSPWRLMVSAKDPLTDWGAPELNFFSGDQTFEVQDNVEAQNAKLKVDGFPVEGEGNKLVDFMSGVTLNLKQAKEGETFTLTIVEDTPKMLEKVKSLVGQLNGVLEFINKQNQVGKETDTRSTFAGDVMLQNIEYRVRNVMHEGFPVWGMTPENTEDPVYMHLHDLGIEMDKKGQITVKEDKLQKAIEKNPELIGSAVSGEFGLANQLKNIIQGYVDPQRGTLKIKENAIQSNIKRMDDQIAQKEKIFQAKTERIQNQFAKLEQAMSDMKNQQARLGGMIGGA